MGLFYVNDQFSLIDQSIVWILVTSYLTRIMNIHGCILTDPEHAVDVSNYYSFKPTWVINIHPCPNGWALEESIWHTRHV